MTSTRKSFFARLIDERDPASAMRFCVIVVTLTSCFSIGWATVKHFDSASYWVNIGVIVVGALAVKLGQKVVESRSSSPKFPTAPAAPVSESGASTPPPAA